MRITRWLLLLLLLLLSSPKTHAQTEYVGDGISTPLEEEIRWLLNRGRFDRNAENALRGTNYTDIPATSGPLATHASLLLSARHHSEDMARRNRFQHQTVPGSFFYNPVTQPQPWDRMLAEGYSWNSAAENISAGQADAAAAYLDWWNSNTGHRTGMYNPSLREIGCGFYFDSSSEYHRYYTMNLGARNDAAFFTDTIYRDANGNSAYNQGEGVAEVRVEIRAGGAILGQFDESEAAGNFAIPIQGIANGTVAYVTLINPGTVAKTVTIPINYRDSVSVQIAPGARRLWGHFTKTSGVNAGFRNLSLTPVPTLQITVTGNVAALTWPSHPSYRYQLFSSENVSAWTALMPSPVLGTGSTMSFQDTPIPPNTTKKFYRLELSTP